MHIMYIMHTSLKCIFTFDELFEFYLPIIEMLI